MIRSLAEIEKEAILEAIIEHRTPRKAAKALGISKSTIYERIGKYGMGLKIGLMVKELRKQRKLFKIEEIDRVQ